MNSFSCNNCSRCYSLSYKMMLLGQIIIGHASPRVVDCVRLQGLSCRYCVLQHFNHLFFLYVDLFWQMSILRRLMINIKSNIFILGGKYGKLDCIPNHLINIIFSRFVKCAKSHIISCELYYILQERNYFAFISRK